MYYLVMLEAHRWSTNTNAYLMMQTCLLVAMFVTSSVSSGHGSVNLREESEREPPMVDNIDDVPIVSIQDTPLPLHCGRRPAMETNTFGVEDNDGLDNILGENRAEWGEVPWQVNLFNGDSLFCGGAVLNEFWILTSAKCAPAGYERFGTLVVGDYSKRNIDAGEQTFDVEQFIPHELYSESSLDYNIGLVKVSATSDGHGIQFSDYIQPICLLESGEACPSNTAWTASGWVGENTQTITDFGILKRVDVLPYDRDSCRGGINASLLTDQISCAQSVYDSTPVGACFGEEGGPIACAKDDVYIITGVVSHVTQCDPVVSPLLYTSVVDLLPWIQSTIAQHSDNTQNVLPSRGNDVSDPGAGSSPFTGQ